MGYVEIGKPSEAWGHTAGARTAQATTPVTSQRTRFVTRERL
jgi:hypothetical protein